MLKAVVHIAVLVGLAVCVPRAHAEGDKTAVDHVGGKTAAFDRVRQAKQRWQEQKQRHVPVRAVPKQYAARYNKGKAVDVPELDPGAATGALALLLGGLAILAERRRRPAESSTCDGNPTA